MQSGVQLGLSIVVVVVVICCVVGGVTADASPLSCLDESGAPVDWFYAIKLPTIPKDSEMTVREGYAYMYGDVNTPNLEWITTRSLKNNTFGAIALTLTQIYTADLDDVAWVMYNDQLVGSEHSSNAHSKGVLAGDSSSGFWLVHSVPRFPVPPTDSPSYYYPSYETENGQSFLCVSYTATTIDEIAGLFLINKPYVFSSNLPSSLMTTYHSIDLVLQQKWVKTASAVSSKLVSLGGTSFIAFAKNSIWDKDLYEDLVSPTFKEDMNIQTWRTGERSNLMPSYCTPNYSYNNINVLTLQAHATDITKSVTWAFTKDHSKWGVTAGGYACIGDINRMFSQFKRGGGTLCFNNPAVYKSLSGVIATLDSC